MSDQQQDEMLWAYLRGEVTYHEMVDVMEDWCDLDGGEEGQ